MQTWTTTSAVLVVLAAAPAQAGTLLQDLTESGRYEHFLAGLRAADLDGLLSGPGPVTVFAPTDTAYERVVSPARQAAFDDDPALVRRVMATHVVRGAAHPADSLPRALEAASGETLSIAWTGTNLTLRVQGGDGAPAVIGGTAIRSSNGVAHPLDGILMPQQVDGGAAMSDDGSFLDDAVAGADRSAVTAAAVEPPQENPADTARDTARDTAETAAEEAARTAAAVAPSPTGTQAPVVVEEMNVTVDTAPPMQPRTVAPSEMMGTQQSQQRTEPRSDRTASKTAATDQQTASAENSGSGDGDGEGDGATEEFLGSTVVGWSLYDSEGEEIGEVEHLILSQDTGGVDGVLVEVGGFLGTGLGGRLVRVDRDELRIDLADEALVTDLSADEITGRDAYQGPELDP